MSENIAAAIAAKNAVIAQQGEALDEIAALLETKAAGGSTDLSLGLTSASVGQIIKVKAVDEDGKPTEWETAEMAGGDKWELIQTIALQSDTTITVGNLATYKKIMAYWGTKNFGTKSGNNWFEIYDANDKLVTRVFITLDIAQMQGMIEVERADGLVFFRGFNKNNMYTLSELNVNIAKVDLPTGDLNVRFSFSAETVATVTDGAKFDIYGVRA